MRPRWAAIVGPTNLGASERIPVSRDRGVATIDPHGLTALAWAVIGHAGGAPGWSRDLAALGPVRLRSNAATVREYWSYDQR
jgi:hypothetical protein